MTTTAYTVDEFIDDVREIFDATQDPLAQAQGVADKMEVLLQTPGWLEERLELPDEGGYGRYDLHLDEDYGHPGGGFWLMASVQKPDQDNLPHDHGAAWVVYGVYEGAIKQTKFPLVLPGRGRGLGADRGDGRLRAGRRQGCVLPAGRDPHHPERHGQPGAGGAAGVAEAGPGGAIPVQPGGRHRQGDGAVGFASSSQDGPHVGRGCQKARSIRVPCLLRGVGNVGSRAVRKVCGDEPAVP